MLAMADLSPAEYPTVALSLFGGFTLDVDGRRVLLPRHSRRVLAYLALATTRTNDVDRRLLAERLWPDSSADRAAASLRTALWRIRRDVPAMVHTDRERVSLGPGVAVDVHGFQCLVGRLLAGDHEPLPEELQVLTDAVDLLPTWEEDWLVLPREQFRQKRLMALESTARRLSEQARYLQAIELMLAVIAAEPLRESAHAMLIDAHLRQGNTADARWQLLSFARELWSELSVHPSPTLLGKLGISSGRLTHFLSA
jgi:DNA-binding SARP family transcriptional activator